MLRAVATNSLLIALALSATAQPLREAPHPTATPADQLAVAGNACGPAALLNAFRFGSESWQRASSALPGESDAQRIRAIIQGPGMRPSAHIKGRARWSKKGVNIADLTDIANELTRGHYLPQLSQEILFTTDRETPEKLLRRAHRILATSLEKGLPPILSLRRYTRRVQNGTPQWIVLDAHFVTLTRLPRKLGKNDRSFPVSYIDPWGGKSCQGTIALPESPVLADHAAASPCLVAHFPQASVGKKLARPGETSALTLAAALGRW
jgi:hypothetical protein